MQPKGMYLAELNVGRLIAATDDLRVAKSRMQQWIKASLQRAGVTPPDCKLRKT